MRIGLGLLLGATAGCFPTFSTHFSPTSSGAQVLTGRCPTEPGAVARFAHDGVFLSLRAAAMAGGGLLVQFAFEIPQGHVVEFKGETGQLQFGGESVPFNIEADHGPYVYVPMVGASIPKEDIGSRGWALMHEALPGSEGDRMGVAKSDSRVYGFKARVAAKVEDQFSVSLPRYAVDGVLAPELKVDFRRQESFVISSMNC
jgi:hypothetical protein